MTKVKNDTFDYLQSKSLNKSELSRTANKNDLNITKFNESPQFTKNNNGAVSNLGIYHNKTFYSVNQPKRSGTSLTTYQDEEKRKRGVKKFRGKINVPNTSNSAAAAVHPDQFKLDSSGDLSNTAHYKLAVKGNEKVFLPINEVLNQARIDQISNTHTLSDILKNLSSTRKNKPSLLENINNAIDKSIIDLGKSRGPDGFINEHSLTHDEISEIKKNLNLMNIQKSVLGSAGADQRESRPSQSNNFFNSNISKKSSSSCGVSKSDAKSESVKLYNRTDKNGMNKTDHYNASRNNAYNSLVD